MKDTIKIKSDGTRDDSQINHIKMALMTNRGPENLYGKS
jgi:hypothetical protein